MSSLEWKLCWAIRLLFYDKQVDETVWFFQWENGGCELSELEMKIKTIPVCAVWNSAHQFNPAGKHNGLLGVWNCLKQYPLPLVLVVFFLFQHTDTVLSSTKLFPPQLLPPKQPLWLSSWTNSFKSIFGDQGEELSGPAQFLTGNGL